MPELPIPEFCENRFVWYRCTLLLGHEGPEHIARGKGGRIVARWDVEQFVPVVAPQLLAEADSVRAREARRRVYAQDERRKAARALDAYLSALYGTPRESWTAEADVAGEKFVERVGDYVLSRLAHKSHYGVPRCPVDGQFCSTCRIGGGNGTGGECEGARDV